MTDINLKTETPDTTLPTTGFLFGADSQAAASPSVFTVQSVATTLLGSTTLSGATITADAPVLNLAQTWNNAAVTFTGLKANVTDTASNAASLLMDLQVGGVSRVSVSKSGDIITGVASAGSITTLAASFGNGLWHVSSIRNPTLFAGGGLNWVASGTPSAGTIDTIISRRGAANLRFGAADAAAPVAQTLSVQSVVAGTTNTAGANLTITGSQGTGTGAGGSIIFQVAPAGSSGTAQNALADALTIDSTKLATFADAVRTSAPSGGTAANWKLGTVATVTPTLQNRTIEVDIGGTIYYISAKTTND
jgi:hypothetical protein